MAPTMTLDRGTEANCSSTLVVDSGELITSSSRAVDRSIFLSAQAFSLANRRVPPHDALAA
jgi:hypothetical protein